MKLRSIVAFILFITGLAGTANAVVHVNSNNPAGGNGLSWQTAFNSLDGAIASSGENQEFWVAGGTYSPSNTLTLKAGSRLFGGFAGNETDLSQRNIATHPTILDGRSLLNHVLLVNMLTPGVQIDGFTIANGSATGTGWEGFGGGVFVDQQPVVIANCTFLGNFAAVQGGAVFINRTDATISNCSFSNNSSAEPGGALANFGSNMSISNTRFQSNTSGLHGGAVYHEGGSLQASNCTFTGNTAYGYGGAVSTNLATATIQKCNFQGNHVAEGGGALSGFNGHLIAMDCLFDGNSANLGAQSRGGAIWHNLNAPQILNCTFTGNSALHSGGAVELNNSVNALVSGCNFSNNQAGQAGGGLSVQWDQVSSANSTVSVEQCSFESNHSGLEGGAIYSNRVHVLLRETIFRNNSGTNGGALMLDYNISETTVIERCRFIGNRATVIGGGVRSYARSVLLSDSLFAFNSAPNAGGIGMHSGNGVDHNPGLVFKLINCTLSGNSASSLPGTTDTGYGGAILNTNVPAVELFNCILWGNLADREIWNVATSSFNTTPDVFNGGDSSMVTLHTAMESLQLYHGSLNESHSGSFSIDPQFVDPDGEDNVPGTLDDNFRLMPTSPCIDRADGGQARNQDIELKNREDSPGISNQGTGIVNYADIGAYETTSSFVPTVAAPHLTAATIGTTVTLSWNPVVNASRYTLFFAPQDLSFIGSADLGTMTSVSAPLFNGATFYVAIQATAYADSAFSPISNIEFFFISN